VRCRRYELFDGRCEHEFVPNVYHCYDEYMGGGPAVLDIEAVITALGALTLEGRPIPLSGDESLLSERLVNAATAYAAVCQDAFDRSGLWGVVGAPSAANWLAERTGASRRLHKGRIADGVALRLLPTVVDPAAAGLVPAENLRHLSTAAATFPAFAVRDEAVLVPQAATLAAREHRAAVNVWLSHAGDASDQLEPVKEPVSELFLSETSDGVRHLTGTLVGEDGETVAAAIEAIVDPLLRAARDHDPSVEAKPGSVLRAMALVDLCAQSLRHEPSDASAPDRYRVAVVVPWDATEPDRPVGACDCTAYRVVLGAAGEVLDIGRSTQRWSTAIRRAITIRDGGCVFPGCDRKPAWTDIHHCEHWEHGGRTSVDNGALLCRRHHTFIHKDHWSVAIDHGRPCVRLPDGTPYVITPWRSDTTPTRPDGPRGQTPPPSHPGHADDGGSEAANRPPDVGQPDS
jgi:hypothetical protein